MLETDERQNLRLGLEEAHRYLRYIDNFFWILSSFMMIGTGFAFSEALEWGGESMKILIMGIIMIVGWVLFLFFKKNIIKQSDRYFHLINFFERRLEIHTLPEQPNAIFGTIMTIVACLSIALWIGLIAHFVVKNCFNLWHFYCLFH